MEKIQEWQFYYTLGIMLIISLVAKYLAQVPALKLFWAFGNCACYRYGIASVKRIKKSRLRLIFHL